MKIEHGCANKKMIGWWFGTWILWLSIQLGISSSPLTNSIIFQRGRSTTNQMILTQLTHLPVSSKKGKIQCILSSTSSHDHWVVDNVNHRTNVGPGWLIGYGSIPINTIFSGLFTSINPSYFDVNYRGIGFWHTGWLIGGFPPNGWIIYDNLLLKW